MVTAEQVLGGAGDGCCWSRSPRVGGGPAGCVSLTQGSKLGVAASCFFTRQLTPASGSRGHGHDPELRQRSAGGDCPLPLSATTLPGTTEHAPSHLLPLPTLCQLPPPVWGA